MTFTDADLDEIVATMIAQNRFLSDGRSLAFNRASVAITYLRQRDPIGAVIMRERAVEIPLQWLRGYPHSETRKSISLSIRALPVPTDAEQLAYALELPEVKALKLAAENHLLLLAMYFKNMGSQDGAHHAENSLRASDALVAALAALEPKP